MNKIKKLLNHLYYRVFFTPDEEEFLKKIETSFASCKKENSANDNVKILLQMPEDYFYLVKFYMFFLVLTRKYKNVDVDLIQISDSLLRRGKISLLQNSSLYDVKWNRLYKKMFNGNIVFNFNVKSDFAIGRYKEQAINIFDSLKSKESVLDITYKGYSIGPLVYDYYLRVESRPSVDFKSPVILEILTNAIRMIDKLEDVFNKNNYSYYLTSYVTYTVHGVPSLIALRNKVKVISFAGIDQFCFQIKLDLFSNVKNYVRYKDFKNKIGENELAIARTKIEERFKGVIDLSTSYMRQSSYSLSNQEFIFERDKPIVVIFLHCFFDSPHIYRNMLFPDFYEWLKFTLTTLSNNQNIKIYIKKHPNAVEGNDLVIKELLSDFLNVKVIPHDFSNLQIANSMKPVAALTVYGTVAHEMAYLGIPVFCSGDNPHIDFEFQKTAKTIQEYKTTLENIHNVNPYTEEELAAVRTEVLRFFYLHNVYQFPEKLNETEQVEHNVIIELFKSGELKNFNRELTKDKFNKLISKLLIQFELER